MNELFAFAKVKRFAIAAVLNPSSHSNSNGVVLFPGPRRATGNAARYASSASFLVPYAVGSSVEPQLAEIELEPQVISKRSSIAQQDAHNSNIARKYLLDQTANLLAAAAVAAASSRPQQSLVNARSQRQLTSYDRPALMSPLLRLQEFGAKRAATLPSDKQQQTVAVEEHYATANSKFQANFAAPSARQDDAAVDTRRYSSADVSAPRASRLGLSDEESSLLLSNSMSANIAPDDYSPSIGAQQSQVQTSTYSDKEGSAGPVGSYANAAPEQAASATASRQSNLRLLSSANNNNAQYESPENNYAANEYRPAQQRIRQHQTGYQQAQPRQQSSAANNNEEYNSPPQANDGSYTPEHPQQEAAYAKKPDRLAMLLKKSQFSCANKKDGYYADNSVECQAFHYCVAGAKHSWQCPEGTVFHQVHLNCVPASQDICDQTERYHMVNEYLYKPMDQNGPNQTTRYHQRYYPEEFTLGMPSAGITYENVAAPDTQPEAQPQPQVQPQPQPQQRQHQTYAQQYAQSQSAPSPPSTYSSPPAPRRVGNADAAATPHSSRQTVRSEDIVYASPQINTQSSPYYSSPVSSSSARYSSGTRAINSISNNNNNLIYGSYHQQSNEAATPPSYSRSYPSSSSTQASRSLPSLPHSHSANAEHANNYATEVLSQYMPSPSSSNSAPSSEQYLPSSQYSDSEPDYRNVPSAEPSYSSSPSGESQSRPDEAPAYTSHVRTTAQSGQYSAPVAAVTASYQRAVEPIRGVARTLISAEQSAANGEQSAEAHLYSSSQNSRIDATNAATIAARRATAEGIPVYGRNVMLRRRELTRNYSKPQSSSALRPSSSSRIAISEFGQHNLIRDALSSNLQVSASSRDELQVSQPLRIVRLKPTETGNTTSTQVPTTTRKPLTNAAIITTTKVPSTESSNNNNKQPTSS